MSTLLNDPLLALRVGALMLATASTSSAASIEFFSNSPGEYDHLRQASLPADFGTGEFTFEVWLRLDEDASVGSTAEGSSQRLNWSNANPAPYSSSSWWYSGNFLLDGHNNSNSAFWNGTFSLQVFNGGRLRWLFGDGNAAAQRAGGLHAVQNAATASLLDGRWHQVTLIRRANGGGALLEMWIDGSLVDSETSSTMTDMTSWWNSWPGFPQNESGWFWGSEKQAALNKIAQYEDYKGHIDELRFWSRAKSGAEVRNGYQRQVSGSEPGLVGWYSFENQSVCNQAGDASCMTTHGLKSGARSSADAPLSDPNDSAAPSLPSNLTGAPVNSTQIDLSWNASTDNVAVFEYRIVRNGTLLTTTTRTSFSDKGLTPSTTYTYVVTARDTAGNDSDASPPVDITTPESDSPNSDTTAPSTPTNVAGSAITRTRIDLSWTAATDNVAVDTYRVTRNGVVVNNSVTGTTFSDITVTSATTYTYSIAARDAAGNVSSESTTITVTTPTTSGGSNPGGGGGGSIGIFLLLAGLLRLPIGRSRSK